VYGASNHCFPVPVSPVISTVESVGATFTMLESTVCRAGDEPTISSNMTRDRFAPQRKVFVTHPSSARLRSSISVPVAYQRIMSRGRREGIVADKKPAILPSFQALVAQVQRLTARETPPWRSSRSLSKSLRVRPVRAGLHSSVLQSETGVIEHCLICIKGCPSRAQHVNITGDGIGHPAEVLFSSALFAHAV